MENEKMVNVARSIAPAGYAASTIRAMSSKLVKQATGEIGQFLTQTQWLGLVKKMLDSKSSKDWTKVQMILADDATVDAEKNKAPSRATELRGLLDSFYRSIPVSVSVEEVTLLLIDAASEWVADAKAAKTTV